MKDENIKIQNLERFSQTSFTILFSQFKAAQRL